jgi:hypothetical protein
MWATCAAWRGAASKSMEPSNYDCRPELILNRISQITGGAAMIPALPKNYDVENRGHYSAGHLRPTKKPTKVKATPNPTAIYGNDVEGAEPPE